MPKQTREVGTQLRGAFWYFFWQERDADGVSRKRWARAIDHGQPNTTQGAGRARAAKLAELAQGVHATARTVNDLIERFIATNPRLRPQSRYTYRHAAATMIAPYLGDRVARDLTRGDVRGWLATLAARGLSPASIQQARKVLSAALTMAVGDDELPRNVAQLERAPSVRLPERAAWDDAQIAAFLAAAEHDADGTLWTLLILTGLRIGEACALAWADVDLTHAALVVRQNRTRDERGRPTLGEPKSSAGRRRVTLPALCVAMLRDQRDRQAFGPRGPWVFPGIKDPSAPMLTAVARRRLRRFCAAHGLPDASPHLLRHIHASWLVTSRADPRAITARLGHARLSTLDRYAHLTPGAEAALAATLDARLAASAEPSVDARVDEG